MVQSSHTIPLSAMVENELSDEDIDILLETLSKSEYSDELLKELENLTMNTLKDLLGSLLNYDDFELATLSFNPKPD